ncbi:phosphoenolpyruvate synthase [Bacillus marinisedimentorum]|uniref:phosphoenolpyruvate synthase n=1 Tax=Bacillus marinisedimentorum TaxID=1821260 RepID=UPI0007E191A2|nr:phosphoenolpyruvate synthase [Bacillus marinisedimentorum]
MIGHKFILGFEDIGKEDIPKVGGKGANLGELTRNGIQVPPGFCVTSDAYIAFIEESGLQERIKEALEGLDFENTDILTEKSRGIRSLIEETRTPDHLRDEIVSAYEGFCQTVGQDNVQVAVRSSATAEDLPEASFAGQQDTYLEVAGTDGVLEHVKKCWASLWTARAIYYREQQGFNHFDVALSAVVQKMVNSEKSGVMFTANPITHNRNEIMINASWGLGEAVVSGMVSPDEYVIDKKSLEMTEKHIANKNVMVVKRDHGNGTVEVSVKDYLGFEKVKEQCLTAEEIEKLASQAAEVENVYGQPQDIEWAYDDDTKELYILQARPITTLKGEEQKDMEATKQTEERKVLIKGLAASPGMAAGKVRKVRDVPEFAKVEEGDILVTTMTNPDMIPAMKRAAAVITDEGGRTCHAAIVSRELGIPCIVSANHAMDVLEDGSEVTVDAIRGVIYKGRMMQEEQKAETSAQGQQAFDTALLEQLTAPVTGTKLYMNLGEPSVINKYKQLPFDGIGLMRTEMIFNDYVQAHPMYLLKTGQGDFMIDKLAEGITTVAQEIFPKPIVVRLSDFRTNEFRGLKGGEEVEPVEHNPMIGWRGVSRYISPEYREGFRHECRAIKKVREEFGLTNVWVMLPFVRTTWELEEAKKIMAEEGLVQNQNFKLWIMAEVPSVIFAAEEFAQLVDGFSIGSNDLTQLVLGIDRDSGILNRMGYFDERDISVKRAIQTLIKAAHKHGKTVSICGQGPSLYPDLTEFLVEEGIDSISVNPDTVSYTRRLIAQVEQRLILKKLRG